MTNARDPLIRQRSLACRSGLYQRPEPGVVQGQSRCVTVLAKPGFALAGECEQAVLAAGFATQRFIGAVAGLEAITLDVGAPTGEPGVFPHWEHVPQAQVGEPGQLGQRRQRAVGQAHGGEGEQLQLAKRSERRQAFDQQRLEAGGIATKPQLAKFWQALQEAQVTSRTHVGDVQGHQRWQLCQCLDVRGRRSAIQSISVPLTNDGVSIYSEQA